MHLLAAEHSGFNTIKVYDTTELYGELGKFRVLQFGDEAVQGAIDLRQPSRIVLHYQRAVVHLMDTIRPAFAAAFMIGHGAGTIAGHYRDRRIAVAELDPAVVALSRAFFGYRGDNVAVGDGRELLAGAAANSQDFIVVDAFTSEGTPPHLATAEFYELARGKLRAGGALLVNVIGRGRRDKRVGSMLATLRAVFPVASAMADVTGKTADAAAAGVNLILAAGDRSVAAADAPPGFAPVELEPGFVSRDRSGPAASPRRAANAAADRGQRR